MRYSYNWLKELSDTKLSPEKIVDAITMHSFEVEEVEKVGSDLAGVIVGEILEIEKHPNADKLQLTKVNIGKEVLQIVCGAYNISVGDKVPVATVGTILSASSAGGPGDFKIKEAEIRGVKSFGMLCAEDELGLGTDHSGIILLDKKAKVGSPAGELLSEKDTVLDIKILPDRAHDALSHVAMAREIVAISGGSELDYDYDGLVLPKSKTKKVSVEIENSELCERYIAVVMENVRIGQSPQWLKSRLENCGIRSINNVVDVTNYVMLELGQPLHAFDLDKISGEFPISNDQFPNKSQNQKVQIIIRNAKKGEKIVMLDGSSKELKEKDIVITNKKEAIALAGVMGGKESGVSETTKTIVLESATFNPAMIRKTKNRLNLLTDAAQRFEKGIDPNLAEKAMVRAIELLEHIAGAKLEGCVDEYPKKKKSWTIKLDMGYADKLLGEKIPIASSKKILKSMGFGVRGNDKQLAVEVPTFRLDALTQEDLIEEIGRIYGYEKINSAAPLVAVSLPKINEKRSFERGLKNILVSQGFSEVLNYAFYGQKDADYIGMGSTKHLELEMPMTPEHSLLRVSLAPGMLRNVEENLKRGREFQLFELGRVFHHDNKGVLPEEKTMLTGMIATEKRSLQEEKADKRHASIFFEIKSHVDGVLSQLGIDDFYYDTFEPVAGNSPSSLWHQSRSAEIKIEGSGESIGFVGEINPFVLSQFGISTRVAMFEFDAEKLRKVSDAEREFEPIRKHPIVTRDISMVAENDVRVDDILQSIQMAGGEIVLDVDLFDAIDFADETSSFAFHVILGADKKTLTGKEIDEVMEKITSSLESELKVRVRK